MIVISAKANLAQIRELFAPYTRDVQLTTLYRDYRAYPAIVVQFACPQDEQRARALVAKEGKRDDQHA